MLKRCQCLSVSSCNYFLAAGAQYIPLPKFWLDLINESQQKCENSACHGLLEWGDGTPYDICKYFFLE